MPFKKRIAFSQCPVASRNLREQMLVEWIAGLLLRGSWPICYGWFYERYEESVGTERNTSNAEWHT